MSYTQEQVIEICYQHRAELKFMKLKISHEKRAYFETREEIQKILESNDILETCSPFHAVLNLAIQLDDYGLMEYMLRNGATLTEDIVNLTKKQPKMLMRLVRDPFHFSKYLPLSLVVELPMEIEFKIDLMNKIYQTMLDQLSQVTSLPYVDFDHFKFLGEFLELFCLGLKKAIWSYQVEKEGLLIGIGWVDTKSALVDWFVDKFKTTPFLLDNSDCKLKIMKVINESTPEPREKLLSQVNKE